jgi:uncharacterized heparinase superfamily protein
MKALGYQARQEVIGISRLFHTVRYLTVGQIRYRLYYRFFRPQTLRHAIASRFAAGRRTWSRLWMGPFVFAQSYFGGGDFSFLGESGSVVSATDWNQPDKTKLWLYNLHYLDDLNAVRAEERYDTHVELIERWINENPPLVGNGWEPYPLSLRLVNLVKWLARQESVKPHWLGSLCRQAQALAALVEYHILGNHLFSNGKALVFVGAFLDGAQADEWLKQGLRILDREIGEQFLADGGHFELSPMYHATLLWDMCDLVNLAEASSVELLQTRSTEWREVVKRGLDWLNAMIHPDGQIPFFNDASFGIAPELKDIQAYAKSLGIEYDGGAAASENRMPALRHLKATGYIAVSLGDSHKVILDVARVGPDYQPGHAHADTLSFELSLFGQRVFVNSGTSQYGNDAERQRQRSTPAHNTVAVDNQDSSEVWAGFRVARRARPVGLEVGKGKDGLWVRCAHDGYRRLPGKVTHQRTWYFQSNMLTIRDALSGVYAQAEAYFYLHPDVQVTKVGEGQFQMMLSLTQSVHVGFIGASHVRLEPSSWHPVFGASVSNVRLVASLSDIELSTSIEW